MIKCTYLLAMAALLGVTACQSRSEIAATRVIQPVNMATVTLTDNFWAPRLERHATAMIPACIDQVEKISNRIRNFENAAKGEGEHRGYFFDDSDVYKLLEGMAYSLIVKPDAELEKKCDEWIDKFAAAQQKDGYLYTFYTLKGLDNRWTDIYMHEMYCMGHMIEAAIAYEQATGKTKLLKVATRAANHMMTIFGPGKRDWVPGHEEIEMAMIRLAVVTGEPKYLDFAHWLLEERGHGHSVGVIPFDVDYHQDLVPVRDLADAYGHSVRAMYLYSAMADVVAYKNDTTYMPALRRLWDDVVLRNMYVTGGIGATDTIEGFTHDYDLPNTTAYSETCASVGMVYWNSRMNQLTGDSKYIDVLERSMYNSGLSGINVACDRFFQPNVLESDGTKHRVEWYGCACCPSQAARFFPTIGNYIYGVADKAIWVNLYASNTAIIPTGETVVAITQQSNYPWDGKVEITLNSATDKALHLRIPDWCKSYTVAVNGEAVVPTMENGYAVLNRAWKPDDQVKLNMEMVVEVIAPDPKVSYNVGKCAVRRGPIVYCLEEIDNREGYDKVRITPQTTFEPVVKRELLGGVTTLQGADGKTTFELIPYYGWDNREASRMKVWMDYAIK